MQVSGARSLHIARVLFERYIGRSGEAGDQVAMQTNEQREKYSEAKHCRPLLTDAGWRNDVCVCKLRALAQRWRQLVISLSYSIDGNSAIFIDKQTNTVT